MRASEESHDDTNATFASGLIHENFTPLEKEAAYRNERETWSSQGAMKVVSRSTIPITANIIGSHVIYRCKTNGAVKARIVPWGHRDLEKNVLRTGMPCMNVDTFRLVVSIAVQNEWKVGEMDITAAFFSSKRVLSRDLCNTATRGIASWHNLETYGFCIWSCRLGAALVSNK